MRDTGDRQPPGAEKAESEPVDRFAELAAKERDIGLCLVMGFIAAALFALPLYSFFLFFLTGELPGISVVGRSVFSYGPQTGNSHWGEFGVAPGSFAFYKHALLYVIMLLLGLVMVRTECALCLRMASMPRFDRLLKPLARLLQALVLLLVVSLVIAFVVAKLTG
jgi:hypothetical protein